MLLGGLQPSYGIEEVPPSMDWTTPPNRRHCDEEYLLLVLALSIFTQLLLVLYVGIGVFQPCSLTGTQSNECQKRIFASFIFRRLLLQLDEAFCPQVGITKKERLDSCLRSSEKVISAIQLFRRDALKVLQPEKDLSSALASEIYCVLDEEEHELAFNGYGCTYTKAEVTDKFLMYMLYPERIVPEAK
ncbi:uncharacterized protein LOC108046562 [Drosophila rhopaloa]|uniref:Uncharacterized protein n=2 Tax=Drosophila rhopaloa TaxID=1041015 RepID=A0ABM5HKQ6_DRORH|nr:uncharacterized protein LOC108046562 [Drosophila rhopaloa]